MCVLGLGERQVRGEIHAFYYSPSWLSCRCISLKCYFRQEAYCEHLNSSGVYPLCTCNANCPHVAPMNGEHMGWNKLRSGTEMPQGTPQMVAVKIPVFYLSAFSYECPVPERPSHTHNLNTQRGMEQSEPRGPDLTARVSQCEAGNSFSKCEGHSSRCPHPHAE